MFYFYIQYELKIQNIERIRMIEKQYNQKRIRDFLLYIIRVCFSINLLKCIVETTEYIHFYVYVCVFIGGQNTIKSKIQILFRYNGISAKTGVIILMYFEYTLTV